ncbi:MAG: superoxide dismutase [Epsilonproteobacteria bacterium]|nr:superoxide dismutase [Campylobacterota bacterium]|tara:strand:+ start:1412 stop:1945 length:534 start_codon:yes stop_codon:yes gene_type:complete
MKFIAYTISLIISFLLGSLYYYHIPLHTKPTAAVAIIQPTKGNQVSGVVRFTQEKEGIRVVAKLTGLSEGKHGFHVHEYGECTSVDGMCTGDHFNPTDAPHGHPDNDFVHVGDLGNIIANQHGEAHYDAINKHMTFFGPKCIIGRGLIVHADPDDLQTQPTGNSGKRIGCGVIGIAH